MCIHIVVRNGTTETECWCCGELAQAIGGRPLFHEAVDTDDLDADDCLCGVLPEATAAAYGYVVAQDRSECGDVVLERRLH